MNEENCIQRELTGIKICISTIITFRSKQNRDTIRKHYYERTFDQNLKKAQREKISTDQTCI